MSNYMSLQYCKLLCFNLYLANIPDLDNVGLELRALLPQQIGTSGFSVLSCLDIKFIEYYF